MPKARQVTLSALAAGVVASTFVVVACLIRRPGSPQGAAPIGRGAPPGEAEIRADEEVVFFPSFGYLAPDRPTWVILIHGWIYEPERDSVIRGMILDRFRRFLGLDEYEAEAAIFTERARAFLVDNERGKRITICLGGKRFSLEESGPNGHFQGTGRLSTDDVEPLRAARDTEGSWLHFEAQTRKKDTRTFAGTVQLIGQAGLSVISDIDDTIKISEVADRKALLANTFLREFQAVPGMAKIYQGWGAAGARFHYVSGSPWQLYKPLSEFLRSAGFPAGTFHLRSFRWKDSTVAALFTSPEAMKRETIASILTLFPRRKFILVGDSGEKDPEIYGALAREYPKQVVRILIRDVRGEDSPSPRFEQAFAGVAAGRWTVFREPEKLDPRVP